MKNELCKLLLVEDSEADILLTRKAIEQGEHWVELEVFRNGMDALKFLNEEENAGLLPDLIILDINMPGLSGFEVLKEIRDNERLKHLVVIMFSTSDAPEDILKAYQLGANSFIKKPIDFIEFKDRMELLQKFWIQCAIVPNNMFQNKVTNH